jgi:hypothetical protein
MPRWSGLAINASTSRARGEDVEGLLARRDEPPG